MGPTVSCLAIHVVKPKASLRGLSIAVDVVVLRVCAMQLDMSLSMGRGARAYKGFVAQQCKSNQLDLILRVKMLLQVRLPQLDGTIGEQLLHSLTCP